MEDLIPILIVIAISIIGAVGRKKKRQEIDENIGKSPLNNQQDDFLSWIERITGEEITGSNDRVSTEEEPMMPQENNSTQVLVKEPVVDVVNKYASYTGFITPEENRELAAKEGVRSITNNSFDENDLTKQNDVIKGNILTRQKMDIDLRKAVIYSEILNRKYQ